jgi:hypothetical protein
VAKKPKILICGDSFSSIWPDGDSGWPCLLSQDFDIQNLSQAGVGEYKIYKQLLSASLENFDLVIVNHTSPSRIHTNNHPLHKDGFHRNCDLIYTDISERLDWFNENLKISKKWFEYHYDDQYQIDIYKMIRSKINEIIKTEYFSITHTEISKNFTIEKNSIDFSEIWKNNRGTVNHYNTFGNLFVYEKLKQTIVKKYE